MGHRRQFYPVPTRGSRPFHHLEDGMQSELTIGGVVASLRVPPTRNSLRLDLSFGSTLSFGRLPSTQNRQPHVQPPVSFDRPIGRGAAVDRRPRGLLPVGR